MKLSIDVIQSYRQCWYFYCSPKTSLNSSQINVNINFIRKLRVFSDPSWHFTGSWPISWAAGRSLLSNVAQVVGENKGYLNRIECSLQVLKCVLKHQESYEKVLFPEHEPSISTKIWWISAVSKQRKEGLKIVKTNMIIEQLSPTTGPGKSSWSDQRIEIAISHCSLSDIYHK